jgi:hypothetical protein
MRRLVAGQEFENASFITAKGIPCPVGSEAFDRGSRIGENLILGRERYKSFNDPLES